VNFEPQPSRPLLPTCYRHPDRETRLACSVCERPVCVECVRPAPVGQRCPEHAQGAPRVVTAQDIRAGDRRSAPFSYAVLGVCVAVAVVGLLLPPLQLELFRFGAQINVAVAAGQWWRVFTSAFLHVDLMHLGFNMWALYLFGPPLEREAGSVPFAALYLSSALAGSAAFYLLVPDGQAVGASGAIFGLFGAWLAAAVRTRRTMAGRANLRSLLVLLAINAALPFFVPTIAWQAHLGGMVAGFTIAGTWLVMGRRGAGSAAARTVAAALVGLVALAAVLMS
jgi:membrane associated rhomboid family serine protease